MSSTAPIVINHPARMPGKARVLWWAASGVGMVGTGCMVAAAGWLALHEPIPADDAVFLIAGVVAILAMVQRWLRWEAWTMVPGAHRRYRWDDPEPLHVKGPELYVTLAQSAVLIATGLWLAGQQLTVNGRLFVACAGGFIVTYSAFRLAQRIVRGPRGTALLFPLLGIVTGIAWSSASDAASLASIRPLVFTLVAAVALLRWVIRLAVRPF